MICTGSRSYLAIATWLLAWPAFAGSPERSQSLFQRAERLERDHEWDKACDAYERILARGHAPPGTKEQYQLCLRHALLGARHRDRTFREQVLTQDTSLLLHVYGEVLTKLRANFIEENKAGFTQLYRYGLDGLDLALSDDFFCREHMPDVPVEAIRKFQRKLTASWRKSNIRRALDAEAGALEIALAAREAIHLKPAVVIMEMAAGACSGLDDHTLFLSPGQFRDAGSSEMSVMRQLVDQPSVLQVQVLNGMKGIGYFQLASLERTSPQELDAAVLQLQAQGIRALIIDLRGNPGGSFDAAVQVAERFVTDGVIVSTQSRVLNYNRTYRANNAGALSLPLVVLIDGGTASAAEVVAGAWKDHRRATLVGEPTFGKASIQGVLQLDTVPAGLRITLAKFFSPRAQRLDGMGISPHIEIQQAPNSIHDAQLDMAVEEAARLLELRQ